MKLLIINGPNLNLLGRREPAIYGSMSFSNYYKELCQSYPEIDFTYYQSNMEGDIINILQESEQYDGVILNAGGYTHTSVAIADAIAAIHSPVVEVHISNVFSREEYRRNSLLTLHCIGLISGFGLSSYRLAVESFLLIDRDKK